MDPVIPPGIEEYLTDTQYKLEVEGGSGDWMQFPSVKRFTNAFILNLEERKLLLGYKKRGFAQGVYNGFGGKVDLGETSLQAAHRELEEEAGITAPLKHCGVLFFYQTGHQYAHHIDVYRAETWSGSPIETEEMKPSWFEIPTPETDLISLESELRQNETKQGETEVTTLPLHKMWKDDMLWLPLLVSGRRFIGRVDLEEEGLALGDTTTTPLYPLVKWWIASVDESSA